MRFLIIIITLFSLSCCKQKTQYGTTLQPTNEIVYLHDTIEILTPFSIVDTICFIYADTICRQKNARLLFINDSLSAKLFQSNFKLERVRYYTNIVRKNPSQIKFYKGWIIRAIE